MHGDTIRVIAAREHNLKNVSVDVPKRQLTVVTGVSGSGKSSLVFDTIAAEAQRQLNETFTAFARTFLPSYGQPDVDMIENLSAVIVVDQKRLGGGSRSTVGTITDIAPRLRLLFSRAGEPHVGYSNAFSFNDPQGMCPDCQGLGDKLDVDLDAFLDPVLSLNEGALRHPQYKVGTWMGTASRSCPRWRPSSWPACSPTSTCRRRVRSSTACATASATWSTSALATSRWTGRPRRCRAASPRASRWRVTSAAT